MDVSMSGRSKSDVMQVLVCDAQWAIRRTIVQILDGLDRKLRIVEASTLDEVANRLEEMNNVRLIVIDPFAEGEEPGRIFNLLGETVPGVPIAIFTMNQDRKDILASLERGTRAYIHKSASGEEILKALTRALEDEIYLPCAPFKVSAAGKAVTRAALASAVSDTVPDRDFTLREIEVLQLLAEGRTNAEISRTLGLAVSTVRVYVSSILKKLHLRDRTQAALYASKLMKEKTGDEGG